MLCFKDTEKEYSLQVPIPVSLGPIGKSMAGKHPHHAVDKHICHRLKKEPALLFEKCDASSLLDPEFAPETYRDDDPAFGLNGSVCN